MAEDFFTPLKISTTLPILSSDLQTLFQEKIGNILFLESHTRSDLLYAIMQLLRRSNKATSKDMAAADRLLRYIASTSDFEHVLCPRLACIFICLCRLVLRLLF